MCDMTKQDQDTLLTKHIAPASLHPNLFNIRLTFLLVPARRTLLSTARNMMNDDGGSAAFRSLR